MDSPPDLSRLEAVVDAVEEGILTIDEVGRIVFANASARRLLGISPSDVGTSNVFGPRWELFTEEGVRLGPEDQPAVRVLRRGEPIHDELVILRRPAQPSSILRIDAKPLVHASGSGKEVVVMYRDVTGQIESVRALEASEKRHRTVLSHVGQVVFQTDEAGVLTYLSPAWDELTGRSPEESLGAEILSHIHPDDLEACARALGPLLQGERRFCRHEARVVTREGGSRWVEVRARRTTAKEGGEAGTAGVLTDVTDRRTMDQRVAQARRMEAMGQLAGGVAHDFNNLLTVVLGYSQLMQAELRDRPETSPALREAAVEIFRTSRKAAGLTRQLLTFSRQQILDRTVLNPNATVERYGHFIGRFLPASITCHIELEPRLGSIEMSPTHLEQVLLNLVINARDALEGAPGGELGVRTRNVQIDDPEKADALDVAPGSYVAIEVWDSGCGMDEDTLSRIFEPFFTTKGRDRGTGMGLASVYGIVSQARGAIDVKSAPGEGSTFVILLPRVRRMLGRAGHEPSPPAL